MLPDTPVVTLSALSVRYGETQVLDDLSLTIGPGEIHALMGPNGAGKTTLIRTILGRVGVHRGVVSVAPAGVGLVPQDIALFPALSVRENLHAFARMAGLSRRVRHDRVGAVTSALALDQRQDQVVGQLSGGWQRRVNIAVALLNDPALLVLDEPTVGVDKAARQGLHDVLRQLAKRGTAILITTHDFAEAEALCSHALFLKAGRCIDQGTVPDMMMRAFAGQYLVKVETRVPLTEPERTHLAQFGLRAQANNSIRAILPRERAVRAVATASETLSSLHRAGFEHPGLSDLYHHFMESK